MRSFWSLSLQRQLAIAIGLLLVPVLGAAIWSGTSTFRERTTELGDQTRLDRAHDGGVHQSRSHVSRQHRCQPCVESCHSRAESVGRRMICFAG